MNVPPLPFGRGRREAPGEGLRSLVGPEAPHSICFANRPLPAGERCIELADRQVHLGQLPLTPAALITASHRFTSEVICDFSASGVARFCGTGSVPRSAKRSITFGSFSAA